MFRILLLICAVGVVVGAFRVESLYSESCDKWPVALPIRLPSLDGDDPRMTEAKPHIEEARKELARRNAAVESCRGWGEMISWAGYSVTGLLLILGVIFGKGTRQNSEKIEEQLQAAPKSALKFAALLVVLGQLFNTAGQKIAASEKNYDASVRQLEEQFTKVTDLLHSPRASKPEFETALERLRVSISKKS